MKIQSVIFDNDGTLYPLKQSYIDDIVNRMVWYLSKKLQMTKEEVMVERERLMNKYGVQSTEVAFEREYGIDINDFIEQTYLSVDISDYGNGSKEKLNELLQSIDVPKSILTNNPSQFAKRILNSLGVMDLFEHIVGSGELSYCLKPRVEAFTKALEITGYNPERTLFIDDNPEFLAGAKKAGLTTVLIGVSNEQFPLADYVLDGIKELEKIWRKN